MSAAPETRMSQSGGVFAAANGLDLENVGVPLAGGPFTTLDALGGTFAAEVVPGHASYTPPAVGTFPAGGPCVDIGAAGSGWALGNFPGAQSGEVHVARSDPLGIFIATDVGRILTSADGITWVASAFAALTQNAPIIWDDVAGVFCIVCRQSFNAGTKVSTLYVATSPDGAAWTASTFVLAVPAGALVGAAEVRSIAYSPTLALFVCVLDTPTNATAGSAGQIITSPDGLTWTQRTDQGGGLQSVCWSPTVGLFVAVGGNDNLGVMVDIISTSANGTAWTPRVPPVQAFPPLWESVVWADALGKFVAIGVQPDGAVAQPMKSMTSANGIAWTAVATPWDASIFPPAGGYVMIWAAGFQGGKLIAYASDGLAGTHLLWQSLDAVTWTRISSIVPIAVTAFAYSEDQNTIVGTTRNTVGADTEYFTGAQRACDIYAERYNVLLATAPAAPPEGFTVYANPVTEHLEVISAGGIVTDLTDGAWTVVPNIGTNNVDVVQTFLRTVIGNPDLTDSFNYDSALCADHVDPTGIYSDYLMFSVGGDGGTLITKTTNLYGLAFFPRINGTVAGTVTVYSVLSSPDIRGTIAAGDVIEFWANAGWNNAVGSIGSYYGVRITPNGGAIKATVAVHGVNVDHSNVDGDVATIGYGFSVSTNSGQGFSDYYGLYLTDSGAYLGGEIECANNVDGAAAGLGTLTNAPHAGSPDAWIELHRNGVKGWIPWWHA